MWALLSAFGLDIFAKRFLIAAATITAFSVVFAAFNASLNAVIGSIDLNTIPSWLTTGLQTMPSNTDFCFSTIASTKIASWLFDYQLRIINYRRS